MHFVALKTMESRRFEAIVVRTYVSGEDDLVLHVISKEFGKLSLIAKHSRKSRKRYGSPIDLLDHGRFQMRNTNGSLGLLQSYEPAGQFKALRQNLDRLTTASLVCEAFDLLVHETQTDAADIFEVLQLGLRAINDADTTKAALKACHVCIASLLRVTGNLDDADCLTPTANNLRKLFSYIESHSERRLVSAGAVMGMVQGLARS